MNVYDFDKTIYDGDSTLDFYIFMLKRDIKILKYFPNQIFHYILYKLKIVNKEKFKEEFFSFFKGIVDIDIQIEKFWLKNEKKIKQWYLDQKDKRDIIISASPECLLEKITDKLEIELIATKIDKKTGKFYSKNCYGKEKVKRFEKKYRVEQIDNFYSDHISDFPMAIKSKKAWIVSKNNIKTWEIEFNTKKGLR